MRIITQAIRVIDYENDQILAREIMPEFGNYIQQLVSYIQTNVSVREYRTQSANTEVIRAIVDIVKHRSIEEVASRNVDLIAGRLLRKESEVQEQIGPMGARVQKGSLILALIEKEGNTIFLLAKVEHTDFFDDIDYSIKTGFSKDEKKIWKTCLFEMDDISALQFQAKVYSNTAAKYWWHDFLELQELQSDEVNTKRAFQAVERVLSKSLKKTAPFDHTAIQNAMYTYFNSVDQFDFEEMLERTLKNYKPNDMTPDKQEMYELLPDDFMVEKGYAENPLKGLFSKLETILSVCYLASNVTVQDEVVKLQIIGQRFAEYVYRFDEICENPMLYKLYDITAILELVLLGSLVYFIICYIQFKYQMAKVYESYESLKKTYDGILAKEDIDECFQEDELLVKMKKSIRRSEKAYIILWVFFLAMLFVIIEMISDAPVSGTIWNHLRN